jgi:3'-phosphoadenosine 5'-phosphosulfate sulfotransferase (PAPS reductase)/FAD synthetase
VNPDLKSFDWLLVNSSGGKDSQAMLDVVVQLAKVHGILDRVVVVHADLGRVEWKGTRELAEEQARHYGVRFEVVSKKSADLLAQVAMRGKWPSPKQRYCTSDQKRAQIWRVMTMLSSETRKAQPGKRVRILNLMGLRAQESPNRKKMQALKLSKASNKNVREVWDWLPIHQWTTEQVWERIKLSGVRHHKAYDLGMPRLSCCFCIFAPMKALVLAGKHNPELLTEYVELEKKIGHRFRMDLSLAEVQAAVIAGESTEWISSWTM